MDTLSTHTQGNHPGVLLGSCKPACSHRKDNVTSLVPPSEPETSDVSAYELSLPCPRERFQVVQPSSPNKEEHVRM